MAVTIVVPTFDTPVALRSAMLSVQCVNADAIRDTAGHDPTNDAAILLIDCRAWPGSKVIFINNGLNQTAGVNIVASYDGINVYPLGSTQNTTGNYASFIDPSAVAALTWNYPYFGLKIACTVAPTTGTISAYMSLKTT